MVITKTVLVEVVRIQLTFPLFGSILWDEFCPIPIALLWVLSVPCPPKLCLVLAAQPMNEGKTNCGARISQLGWNYSPAEVTLLFNFLLPYPASSNQLLLRALIPQKITYPRVSSQVLLLGNLTKGIIHQSFAEVITYLLTGREKKFC